MNAAAANTCGPTILASMDAGVALRRSMPSIPHMGNVSAGAWPIFRRAQLCGVNASRCRSVFLEPRPLHACESVRGSPYDL